MSFYLPIQWNVEWDSLYPLSLCVIPKGPGPGPANPLPCTQQKIKIQSCEQSHHNSIQSSPSLLLLLHYAQSSDDTFFSHWSLSFWNFRQTKSRVDECKNVAESDRKPPFPLRPRMLFIATLSLRHLLSIKIDYVTTACTYSFFFHLFLKLYIYFHFHQMPTMTRISTLKNFVLRDFTRGPFFHLFKVDFFRGLLLLLEYYFWFFFLSMESLLTAFRPSHNYQQLNVSCNLYSQKENFLFLPVHLRKKIFLITFLVKIACM